MGEKKTGEHTLCECGVVCMYANLVKCYKYLEYAGKKTWEIVIELLYQAQ